jgi:hypothetical protein
MRRVRGAAAPASPAIEGAMLPRNLRASSCGVVAVAIRRLSRRRRARRRCCTVAPTTIRAHDYSPCSILRARRRQRDADLRVSELRCCGHDTARTHRSDVRSREPSERFLRVRPELVVFFSGRRPTCDAFSRPPRSGCCPCLRRLGLRAGGDAPNLELLGGASSVTLPPSGGSAVRTASPGIRARDAR